MTECGMHHRRCLPALALVVLPALVLLPACTSLSTAPPPAPRVPAPHVPLAQPLPQVPLQDHADLAYREAAAAGIAVWVVDTSASTIKVIVRRAGLLARLGHDHVVASRQVRGYVAPDAGHADLEFRLDEMTVDEAALRREALLDTQPSEEDIAGTRTNMLTRVLDAERYPVVRLRAESLQGHPDRLHLTVTLHGVTRSYTLPARLERLPGRVRASGEMELRQSDFGIKPLAVLGGALRVEDVLLVRFDLLAQSPP
jgi:polyisoprenoid-binding protein YceI